MPNSMTFQVRIRCKTHDGWPGLVDVIVVCVCLCIPIHTRPIIIIMPIITIATKGNLYPALQTTFGAANKYDCNIIQM